MEQYRHHPVPLEEPPILSLVPQPELTHELHPDFPSSTKSNLSSCQEQKVRLACQALFTRRAFFLGDGTGVGKTRVLIGIVLEVWLRSGRRGLWLCPNGGLARQVEAEMRSVGCPPEAAVVTTYARVAASADESKAEEGASLVICDEAHVARNDGGRARRAIEWLQQTDGRMVVYSTATPASEIVKLGYMSRLGLWGKHSETFPDFSVFCKVMQQWGHGALELLSVSLKQAGLYTCHVMPPLPQSFVRLNLTRPQRLLFDECARLWGARLGDGHAALFFRRLVVAFKAELMIETWRRDLASGCSVLVVLQCTGAAAEAGPLPMLERSLRAHGWPAPAGLPPEPIEIILEAFGPDATAEISGRRMQGTPGRRRTKPSNLREADAFMRGDKRIIIVTACGGLGLNLAPPNGQVTRHYTLELPWTPDTFQQQSGRSYRSSDGALPPEYFVVTADTLVEMRVAAALRRRSRVLGAISRGDSFADDLPCSLPEVSARMMRWVAFELSVRSLASGLCREDLVDAIETSYYSAAVRKPLIPPSEVFQNGADKDALTSALRLVPEAHTWVAQWTKDLHLSFDRDTQRRCMAVLLCHKAARGGLGRLPSPVLDTILSFSLGSAAFDAGEVSRWLWPTRSTCAKTALRNASCSPLGIQAVVADLLQRHQPLSASRRGRVVDLGLYCIGRRRGYQARLHVTRRDANLLSVHVEVVDDPVPAHAASFLYVTHAGHIVSRTPEQASSQTNLRNFVPITAMRRHLHAAGARAKERGALARNLSRTLLVASGGDALHRWNSSCHLVVSGTCETAGSKFAGLLMHDPLVKHGRVPHDDNSDDNDDER